MRPFSKERYASAAKIMRSLPELDACGSGHDNVFISDLLENAITMIEANEKLEKEAYDATTAEFGHKLNRRSIEQLRDMVSLVEKRVCRLENEQRERGWY